jgi:hypothetical protein
MRSSSDIAGCGPEVIAAWCALLLACAVFIKVSVSPAAGEAAMSQLPTGVRVHTYKPCGSEAVPSRGLGHELLQRFVTDF